MTHAKTSTLGRYFTLDLLSNFQLNQKSRGATPLLPMPMQCMYVHAYLPFLDVLGMLSFHVGYLTCLVRRYVPNH